MDATDSEVKFRLINLGLSILPPMKMNFVEKAECLLDVGGSGNMSFTIIVAYRGHLSSQALQQALLFLQSEHQTLRITLHWSEGDCSFADTNANVPIRQLKYTHFSQWRQVAHEEVRQRFEDPALPLWRVAWLEGQLEGQLLLTFHHAIADGVCGMQLVNQLFSVLEQLSNGQSPQPLGCDSPSLSLDSLNGLTGVEPEPEVAPAPREDKNYHTDYILDEIDSGTTDRVIQWAKLQQVRLNAVLFAALLLAIRRVTQTTYPIVDASTVVNFRPFLDPVVPKAVMRLTRICVVTPVAMDEYDDMATLARFIHHDLYARLAAGEHVVNLKRLANRIKDCETSETIWRRARIPVHQVILTNVGSLGFTGAYGGLSIDKLFFVANVEPAFDSQDNWILGAVTLRGQMYLTLWYLEELVDETTAHKVLSEMKRILLDL